MITRHLGWTRFYEGCLNSPLRNEIRERLQEVVTNYPVDMMYFDGPYQGMDQRQQFCHCKYCRVAYRKARGKDIPLQNGTASLDDIVEYKLWLSDDVVDGFMHEICDMVRQARDVPIVYNDTGLLGGDWRSRAYRYVDGFMFEAADTPEQKLFNMRVGQSTGKVIWTYISSHTEYNREHVEDKSKRGWYSNPVAGRRLLLDGAVATAAGVGYCYWGLNRVFYVSGDILNHESVRSVREVFAFARDHELLLRSVRREPQLGIVVGTQTVQWYQESLFVPHAYANYYYGAHQLIKSLSYDAEPFLDYDITLKRLRAFRLVYAPNVACLSDAQCSALEGYVRQGGILLATHLSSVADEFGRLRKDYGLSAMFQATLTPPQPVELVDLYLRLSSGKLIPQDPQVMLFKARANARVLAETYSRGDRKVLGPAILHSQHGKGQVIYIGSGLEAIYEETLNGSLRAYFRRLLDPILNPSRSYEVDFKPGLLHQFALSENILLLHLLANTGDIWKKLLVQEHFLPVKNVQVRVRLPENRRVKSVTLMWSGKQAAWRVESGWVKLTVPEVEVYEVIRVDLA